MQHRIKSIGKQQYEIISDDGKTMIEICGCHEPGPRGGRGEHVWQVIEYAWLEPDEFNKTGDWGAGDVIAEPRYFKTAKQIAKDRLVLRAA